MSNENGFNPAYPYHIKLRNKDGDEPFAESVSFGLTKREYIASQCLAALLSTLTIERDAHSRFLAETAVMHADALLRELSSNKESGE